MHVIISPPGTTSYDKICFSLCCSFDFNMVSCSSLRFHVLFVVYLIVVFVLFCFFITLNGVICSSKCMYFIHFLWTVLFIVTSITFSVLIIFQTYQNSLQVFAATSITPPPPPPICSCKMLHVDLRNNIHRNKLFYMYKSYDNHVNRVCRKSTLPMIYF